MQFELSGRLGNQMFQYAFMLEMKHKYKEYRASINTSSCEKGEIELLKPFDLNINISKGVSAISRIRILPYTICKLLKKEAAFMYINIKKMINEDNLDLTKITNNSYFKGYWQSEYYFIDVIDEVKKDFTFKELKDSKNKELLNIISNNNSVAIHIRRSDYLLEKNRKQYICLSETNYYKNAISRINKEIKKPLYIFFSDDIKWCKENFDEVNAIFVDWNVKDNSWKDMYLMSKCDTIVVANSSFSWWGAYLNPNGRIYCPKINEYKIINGKKIYYYPIYWNRVDIV